MRKIDFFLRTSGCLLFMLVASSVMAAERVLLLHGIGRSPRHMQPLEVALAQRGFEVINIKYPSTEHSIEDLVEWLQRHVSVRIQAEATPLHVVGYSMGGLLARAWIHRYRPERLWRVVQLAPPNHGSEVADFFKQNWLFRSFYGPAGQQLGTQEDLQVLLGSVNYELGVLAGNRSIDPFSSWLIPGADDGKVSVHSTRVLGMRAHAVLPVTHTFFPSNAEVHRQTIHFLQQGDFDATQGGEK